MKIPRKRLEELWDRAGLGTQGYSDERLAEATLVMVKGRQFDGMEDPEDADLVDEVMSCDVLEVGEADKKQLGVIDSIVEIVQAAGPRTCVTHDSVLRELRCRFPERDPQRMMNTVKKWLPSRLRAEKHLNVVSTNNGFYCRGEVIV